MLLLTVWVEPPMRAAAQQGPGSSSVEIEAKVQRSPVGLREEVTYVLTVEGASLAEVDGLPTAPQVRGLVPKSRQPSIKQDIVRRNGQIRRTLAFHWTYRPQQTGTVGFEPVSITINGRTYRTETVPVQVLTTARHNTSPPPGDDSLANASDDIFIEASLSDSTLYRGEQAVVSYRLFYRDGLRLRQSRMAGSWDAPGFWREELDVPAHPDVGTTQRNGKAYKTLLLKRVAVFPTRAGELSLSPLKIETHARRPGRARGVLGRLFSSGRMRELNVTSDSVHLRVRPLPSGAPSSFRGAVGTFRIDLRMGETRTRVGQAVELELQVSGYGNLATIEAPPLEASGSLETYAPDTRLSIDRGGDRIRGTKTFTYTIVPQERGTYQLPPLAFSYFAPDAGRYRTLRTQPVTIRASGSAQELPASASEFPPGDLAGPLTGTVAWTRPGGAPLYRRVWPYAAFGLPALLAAALLAWRRRRDRADARPPEAHPTARRRLSDARRHLEHDDPRLFYEEVERALRTFVGQRLGIEVNGQTRRQLRAGFGRADVDEDTQARFFALLDECSRARFAPAAPDREALKTASERAHRLVATLDGALPASSGAHA